MQQKLEAYNFTIAENACSWCNSLISNALFYLTRCTLILAHDDNILYGLQALITLRIDLIKQSTRTD